MEAKTPTRSGSDAIEQAMPEAKNAEKARKLFLSKFLVCIEMLGLDRYSRIGVKSP